MRTRTVTLAITTIIMAIVVAVTGCAGAGQTAAAPEPSAAAGAPPIAQAWAAAWNAGDPAELGRLFTADATYRDLAVGKTWTGQAGVTAWKARTNANIADVHVTLVNAFRNGDQVIVQGTYAGRLQTAPRPFAVPIVTILSLRGDRIADDADHYDVAEILRQSGLPPNWTPPQK